MKKVSKKTKNLFKDMDIGILIISIILLVFGVLNVVNASGQAIVIRFGTSLYNFFFKQLAHIGLGLILAFIIIHIPTKKYNGWGLIAYIFSLVTLVMLLFTKSYQGSQNWLPIGSFRFQPSEFAKITLIVVVSNLFHKFARELKSNKIDLKSKGEIIFFILIVALTYIGLIYLQKDLGTMIIFVIIFGSIFISSPIRRSEKILTIIFVSVLVLFLAGVKMAKDGSVLTASQESRLNYQNPCSRYEEDGYQVCNGYIAINDGGLFGVGIGNSKQISYLPESHTDSVFAIIAEEYGVIVCTFIFMFYILLLYRIFKLSNKVKNVRNKLICIGIGTYIAVHIIINLGGLFGVMPLTGVPLPFLSYGGSFTIALIAALAIIQRIHIEYKREKIKI